MSVDVEKLRRQLSTGAIVIPAAEGHELLTELEILRRILRGHRSSEFSPAARGEAPAELEQLRAEVAELKEERKDWGKDPDEYRVMSQCQMELMGRVEDYRAVLEALVGALPKCDAVTVRGPDMSRVCGQPATHYEVGAWGGECPCPTQDARCDKHRESFDEASWSTPLREALRLLGRGKEGI